MFVDISTTHITLHFEYAAGATQKAGPYKNIEHVLRGISNVVDERSLDNFKNKPCRVVSNEAGEITHIGHFLNETWFTL